MELDQRLLQKVLGLSDQELSDAVTRVALGLGLDQSLLKPYLSKTDALRAALARLTPEDLDKVSAVLGEDRLRETLSNIRRDVDEG